MKLCSIDSSSTCTGMALFKDDKLIKHIKIDLKKEKDTQSRMGNMIIEIYKYIDKWKPDVIYIEDDYKKNNVRTLKILTMIIGGVWAYCLRHNITFHTVMPSSWRSNISEFKGHKERADLKRISMQKIIDEFNIECSEDECDAINIGASVLGIYKK